MSDASANTEGRHRPDAVTLFFGSVIAAYVAYNAAQLFLSGIPLFWCLFVVSATVVALYFFLSVRLVALARAGGLSGLLGSLRTSRKVYYAVTLVLVVITATIAVRYFVLGILDIPELQSSVTDHIYSAQVSANRRSRSGLLDFRVTGTSEDTGEEVTLIGSMANYYEYAKRPLGTTTRAWRSTPRTSRTPRR